MTASAPVFIDTSAMVRKLFGESNAWPGWKTAETAYCSRLARVELKRTLDRERLLGHIGDATVAAMLAHLHTLFATLRVVELSSELMSRSEAPLPTVVKTLDALHIVTAVALSEQLGKALVFVTHDVGQGRCARALGLTVEGV